MAEGLECGHKSAVDAVLLAARKLGVDVRSGVKAPNDMWHVTDYEYVRDALASISRGEFTNVNAFVQSVMGFFENHKGVGNVLTHLRSLIKVQKTRSDIGDMTSDKRNLLDYDMLTAGFPRVIMDTKRNIFGWNLYYDGRPDLVRWSPEELAVLKHCLMRTIVTPSLIESMKVRSGKPSRYDAYSCARDLAVAKMKTQWGDQGCHVDGMTRSADTIWFYLKKDWPEKVLKVWKEEIEYYPDSFGVLYDRAPTEEEQIEYLDQIAIKP